ncbi:MAG TPA: hypothetical protein VMH00_12730 [Candidatus Limnocylindrales bacterium]|nr:hypothetical protein [Candidatus Limnocylindrales bacterium]
MRAVERICEIQLRLDADLDALVLPLPRRWTRTRPQADFFRLGLRLLVEWKAGLGIVRMKMAASRPVFLQAARDFSPPFGLFGFGLGRDPYSYSFGNLILFEMVLFELILLVLLGIDPAEGTLFRFIQQEGATLIADSYHWSVLRCGGSSGTRR